MQQIKLTTQFLISGFLIALISGCGGSGGGSSSSTSTSRDILLQVQSGTDPNAIAQQYGLTITGSVPDENLYQFQIPAGQDPTALAQQLQADPRLTNAETDNGVHSPEKSNTVDGFPIHVPFDVITPTSSTYTSTATAYGNPSTGSINTKMEQQVDVAGVPAGVRGDGVLVAVLDTGVQADHPSLQGHLLPGYNALSPSIPPDDVADGTQNQTVGHGTMVSGIVARLAPGAKILPVRVLNGDGSGSVFAVVRGMKWAMANGAKVINLSLGTGTRSGILQSVINEARRSDVLVVAAVGNAGQEVVEYPAAYNNVLGVAALESNNTKAAYSNYGADVALDAPGSNILSTYVHSGFATWSGTSFATPIVSTAAALIWSAHPTDTADQVSEALTTTTHSVDSQNAALAGKLGSGLVDFGQAVTLTPPSPHAHSNTALHQ